MTALIWDGEEFLEVTVDAAKALAKADKAQIMDGTIDGLSLKTRSEFTGYNKPAPAPQQEPKQVEAPSLPAAVKSEEPDPMAKAVQSVPLKNWISYKRVAAEALGKPFQRTTKADVMKYLEEVKPDVLS